MNKVTRAAQELLDGEAEALTRKAVDMALEGDRTALKLCMDRIIPPRKDRPLEMALPSIEGAGDLLKFSAAILEAVGRGEITPSEGATLAGIVGNHAKAMELHEIEQRLADIEKRLEGKR
ncbi:MAG: hypothetical protein ABIM40_00800 [Pseudomonadota bacterium]